MAAPSLAASVAVVSGHQFYKRTLGNFQQRIANTTNRSDFNSVGTKLVLAGCR